MASCLDLPPSLRSRFNPVSDEFAEKILQILPAIERKFIVLGVNEISRKLSDLAAIVVFLDAGSIVSNLPMAAHLQGVPFAALSVTPKDFAKCFGLKRIAAIGLKRDSFTEEHIAAMIMEMRSLDNQVIHAFGDRKAAKAIDEFGKKQTKGLKMEKPSKDQAKPPAAATKRFFSNLD